MKFDTSFERAPSHPPVPYPTALATGAARPNQLSVPTDHGKTFAAGLFGLWRRRFAGPQAAVVTPSLLVFSLPVRTQMKHTARCPG